MEGYTQTFKTTTKKPFKPGEGGNRVQSMKDAIGKGITNGIDALKKKQEENKAKKEAKKQEGSTAK